MSENTTKFADLKNLYEVRKAVRFELKPSKITDEFLQKEWFFTNPQNVLIKNKEEKIGKKTTFSKKVFEENIAEFLKNSHNLYEALLNLQWVLNANTWWQIFVMRDIFEPIDKNFYIKIKWKLSGWRSVSFREIKNNWKDFWNWVEKILDYFNNLLDEINNQNLEVESINSKLWLSKTDIKKTLKKLNLCYIRIYNFLEKFDLKQEKFDWQIKEKITNILKFEEFFNQCKWYYFMSENQSSWILVRRFWFNERALKRRQPEKIQKELDELKPQFEAKQKEKEELEQQRQKLIEEFDLKMKKKQFPDLIWIDDENWEYKRIKDLKRNDRTQEEWNYFKNINEQLDKIKKLRDKDEEIEKLTAKLDWELNLDENWNIKKDKDWKVSRKFNWLKKQIWDFKRDINNKEKELENNLALTHYAKLLKRNQFWEDFYYLVLIPIDDKNILEENIWNNWDTEILEYKTLTFQAFVKLALSYDGTMWVYIDREWNIRKSNRWVDQKMIKLYQNLKEWKLLNKLNELKIYIKNVIKIHKKEVFDYTEFNFEVLNKTKTLNDYIIEFNKQWYKVYWKKINFLKIKDLEKEQKLEIYQIYCKDFFRDPDFFENIEVNLEQSIEIQKQKRADERAKENVKWNKNLFSIYWENFIKGIPDSEINSEWQKWNQDIRLNSDSWYFLKPKDNNIIEEAEWKSRKKRDKIIWTFNLSFNANKLLSDNYKEEKNITEFNKTYKEKVDPIKQDLSYIWLDRWEKELLTYCVLDSQWNCRKDENWNYLIWDFNLINSKWEFVKKEDCIYKDEDWKKIDESVIIWSLKISKYNTEWWYFELVWNAKLHYDNTENWWFRIETKDWKNIELKDKNWNRVYDYNLIFKLAILRRQIISQKWEITLNDIQEIRGWYISQILRVLNEWIVKYNWVLVLENLWKELEEEWKTDWNETNKDIIISKTFWITIYQEIETLLTRKYNYFVKKDNSLKLQLTPKIKNIEDIKITEKENLDLNLWNIIFVNEYNSSKECPVCSKPLFWHLTNATFENEMHHYKDWYNYWKYLELAKKSKNDNCDYHMKNNTHWFDFIDSWDDLAAYNIAKRGKKYVDEWKLKVEENRKSDNFKNNKKNYHKNIQTLEEWEDKPTYNPFANLFKF